MFATSLYNVNSQRTVPWNAGQTYTRHFLDTS